jgi:putative ABC transport system permease protein
MQPLADIYFGDLWAPRTGDRRYVAVFGAIAGVILLIACVNYMNLATARTTRRGRETGVRKTLGASRALVAVQFVSEAVLLSLMAVPVALALVALAVPSFNALTGAEVVLEAGAAPLVGVVVGAALVVGLVAGSYPAVALSRYRPLQMIRGQLDTGAQGRRVRQGLVVVQFALTAALLFATGMVLRQLDYLQARDLGFEEEQVVGLELADETVRERAAAVRDAFAAVPGVEHVTLAAGLPGSDVGYFGRIASSIERDGKHISLHHGYVDAAYAEALGLRLVAGRLLRPGDAASERVEGKTNEPILLNETAARAFGWDPPAEAVGQTLSYFRGDKPVVGVVEDFHYASLHHAIEPLALHVTPQFADRVVAVRLRAGGTGAGGEDGGGDVRATLARLEAAWDDVAPHLPFEPRFLDATVDAQYRAEERAARLVTAFAAVAVVLACLGLFGLATYAAARRTKEISIRKVLGATTRQVVTLLSKEFAALVALALLLGAPLAFYGVTQWLDGFAYRAPLSPASFLLAGALAMAVALASVGVQTVRAARLDPARALRSE